MKNNILDTRRIYLENRENEIEEFNSFLSEIKIKNPNLDCNIPLLGMTFSNFLRLCIFNVILDQEQYVISKEEWINQEEERVILQELINKAKIVFGVHYEYWYLYCKERR